MLKAGVIGAVASFIYVTSLTLLSPFCTLCFTPLLGIGVGYLAGQFDRPPKAETSLYRGAMAGGITGVVTAISQMLASVVNAILVTNSEELPKLMQEFGFSELVITETREYWQVTLSVNALCGVFNLFVIAGLAALGGLIWFQRQQREALSSLST